MTAQILFKFRSNFCGFSWSPPLNKNDFGLYFFVRAGSAVVPSCLAGSTLPSMLCWRAVTGCDDISRIRGCLPADWFGNCWKRASNIPVILLAERADLIMKIPLSFRRQALRLNDGRKVTLSHSKHQAQVM